MDVRARVAAVACVALAAAPSAHAARWTKPAAIGTSAAVEEIAYSDANASGDVAVSWGGERGAQFAVAPGGHGFREPVLVPDSDDAYSVMVGLGPRREVSLAWDHDYDSEGDLYSDVFAAGARAGHAIAPPTNLSPSGHHAEAAGVFPGPGGRAATWFRSGFEGRPFLAFASGAGSWTEGRSMPGDVLDVRFLPGGAADFVLAVRRRIRVARRSPSGELGRPHTTARVPGPVVASGADRRGLVVALVGDGERRLVGFTRERGRLDRAQLLDREERPSWLPSVAVAANGRAIAAWQSLRERTTTTAREIVVATRAPGGRLGRPQAVGPEPGSSGFTGVVTGIAPDGTAVVAWASDRGGRHAIFAAVARDGEHFERPRRISRRGDPRPLSEPSLVVPGDGRALIAWTRGGAAPDAEADVEVVRLRPPAR